MPSYELTDHPFQVATRWFRRLLPSIALVALLWIVPGTSLAAPADQRLEATQQKIGRAKNREGVLTTDIERFGNQISVLEGEVTDLRGQETAAEVKLAAEQDKLEQAIVELDRAVTRLRRERERLGRALANLRKRLVSMYMSGPTDVASLVLASRDFGELVAVRHYLEAIQTQSEDLAERVRTVRNRARDSVESRRESKATIETSRDAISAEQVRLEQARQSLESRENDLVGNRADRKHLLNGVRNKIAEHEEIAAGIRAEIQKSVASASAPTGLPSASPSPVPSSTGMIWPVEGILTSPFGSRWGSTHEGIDISAAEGTPIHAADSGTVILLQPEASSGGYGNYTCIDHGGGLSTCYAHQSAFNTTEGATVDQGQVIGYVGNTGHSFGAHLHFEVRINGVAADPLGYL